MKDFFRAGYHLPVLACLGMIVPGTAVARAELVLHQDAAANGAHVSNPGEPGVTREEFHVSRVPAAEVICTLCNRADWTFADVEPLSADSSLA
ncbi:MAG: hypothetical protein KDA60_22415, partial [Planctomycetales bacterium]|nr:hypothetical protein [Planctomycetales bacterium]